MWALIATVQETGDWIGSGSSFLNLGVTTWVAYYCLTTLNKTLQSLRDAMNNSSKAMLLQLLVHPKFPDEARSQAQVVVNDIDKS